MATFTSWADALISAKNALANRDLTVSSYRTPDGASTEIRSIDDLKKLIGFLEGKAAIEAATPGTSTRRTCAVSTSGGRW